MKLETFKVDAATFKSNSVGYRKSFVADLKKSLRGTSGSE